MPANKVIENWIVGLWVFLLSTGACVPWVDLQQAETGWDDAITKHSIITDQSNILRELWLREVFMPRERGRVQIAAGGGLAFFIGSLEQTEPAHLVALDTTTGNLRWKRPGADTITLSSESVFFGDGSNVFAINSSNGDLIWEQNFPLTNMMIYIYPFDQILQIFTGSNEFLLLNQISGELLARSTSPAVFSHAPHWLLERKPVFLENSVIYRKGERLETITSMRSVVSETIEFDLTRSGEILWETDRHIISNVAVSNNYAFMFDAFDKLLIRDKNTGEIVEALEIVPTINIYGNGASQQEGYHLAFDDQSSILFIVLGDGNQLFAFEVIE